MKLLNKYFLNDPIRVKGSLLVGASIIANFFNLAFNIYLGRGLRIEDFALISLMGSMLMLSDIPVNALSRSVTHIAAFHLGKHKKSALNFWRKTRQKSLIVATAMSLLWALLSIPAAQFFNLTSPLAMLSMSPVWLLTILLAVDGGYLRGNLRFGALALISIIEASVKLILAVLFVELKLPEYTYLAIPISLFAGFILVTFATRFITKKHKDNPSKAKFPAKFFVSNIFTRIATVSFLSADIILIAHFLPASEAGQYALLSLVGKTVFFAGSLFGQFILPIVSNAEGSGRKSEKVFYSLIGATALASLTAFTIVGVFGQSMLPFVFGARAEQILPYIFLYSLSMVAFTIASNIASFHQIKSKNLLPIASFILAGVQIVALGLLHANIGQVATVMSVLGFLNLVVAILIHFLNSKIESVIYNFRDFLDIFTFKPSKLNAGGLRILIYNWRDIKHTWAGGAEVYIHELAKRWVQDGHSVTIFSGNDHKNSRYENYDGIEVIRRGGFYSVYFWAFAYYLLKFRKNYDVVVDSENGIPFFAPLFSTKPVILLIHHVHQEIFREHLKFPLSTVAKFIEGTLMPFVYRNNKVITVSESSRNEIIKTQIAKEENIKIVNPGIQIPKERFRKSSFPTVTYLGRLKHYKNIDVAIRAFAQVNKNLRSSRMWIIGEGESMGGLRDVVIKNNLVDKVTFFGKVNEKEKTKLLSQSWVMVQPSSLEGWGITVIEANACKTPVIASNTKGLRDSIVDNKTGMLVKVRDVSGFSSAIRKVMKNTKLRKEFSNNAYLWAQKFSWDSSADSFMEDLLESISIQRSKRISLGLSRNLLRRNLAEKK